MTKRAPYRSRLRIVADILSVVSKGARKTHIMYGANLSYKLLKQYLGDVLDSGLVRQGNDGWYEITDEGQIFLERCNRYFKNNKHISKRTRDVEGKRENLESLLSAET